MFHHLNSYIHIGFMMGSEALVMITNGKEHKVEIGTAIHKPVEKEFSVRALEISDNKKGFVELIGQLSPTCPLSEEEFQVCFCRH
jgi:hypothetical protein